jgi:hypothetical protein
MCANSTIDRLYVVWHVRPVDYQDDTEKLIGIFSSEDRAREAIERLRSKPGFRDFPDCFEISGKGLNETSWTEGL